MKKSTIIEKIVTNVSNNPHNIAAALRLTAKQTKKKQHQIDYLYYGHVNRGIEGIRKFRPMFITHTKNGIVMNVKRSLALLETKKELKLKIPLTDMKDLTMEQKASWFDIILNK